MQIPLLVFLCSILLPLGMFLFYREVLDNRKNGSVLYFTVGMISVVGIVWFFIEKEMFYLSLVNPLLSLLVYRSMFSIFEKRFGKAPVDTAFRWSPGLFYDRLFNILFIVLGILAPILLSLFFIDLFRN